ncbi:MAG: hypothetical protein QOJ32_153 [Frankiaceae bacterium]|nr:hypothetical protein [Frankiaceae bacterium]
MGSITHAVVLGVAVVPRSEAEMEPAQIPVVRADIPSPRPAEEPPPAATGTATGEQTDTNADASPESLPPVVDVLLGAGAGLFRLAERSVHRVSNMARPLAGSLAAVALRPPGLPERLHPETQLRLLAERGRRERVTVEQSGAELLRVLVPLIVDKLLDSIDMMGIVRRIDLDAAVRTVDIDAIARRLDLGAVFDSAPIERIVTRVDVDAIAERVDLEPIVKRVDVDAVVAAVDLDAVAARLDLDAIIARVDVVGIAQEVVEALDLPEIIRRSTGSMSSDAVRGVRMRSMQADESVARLTDRLLGRRRSNPDHGSSPDGSKDGLDDVGAR